MATSSKVLSVVTRWFLYFLAPIGVEIAQVLPVDFKGLLVPQEGLEPPTPSLRMTCSTN